MTGFIMKIIISPTILLILDHFFKDIYYPYTYQPIFVGIALSVLAHLMEVLLLRPGRVLITAIGDFLLAFILIYFIQFLLPGAVVTLIGASLASTFIAIIEYIEHVYLLHNYKVNKTFEKK